MKSPEHLSQFNICFGRIDVSGAGIETKQIPPGVNGRIEIQTSSSVPDTINIHDHIEEKGSGCYVNGAVGNAVYNDVWLKPGHRIQMRRYTIQHLT